MKYACYHRLSNRHQTSFDGGYVQCTDHHVVTSAYTYTAAEYYEQTPLKWTEPVSVRFRTTPALDRELDM